MKCVEKQNCLFTLRDLQSTQIEINNCYVNKKKTTVMKPLVNIFKAGKIKYQSGLLLQNILTQQPKENFTEFQNYLVLQEFDPVYTIGIRTKNYTAEIEKNLVQLGAEFHRTNRGGLITFHGPGQLVAYPLLHLKQFKPSMRWYIAMLEQMVIDTCKEMGVLNARTTQNTGIWVNDHKICAIGVHGSRYITTHGIGLNCCTDLSWFDHIVPCGIEGKGVTSLSKELLRNVTTDEASEILIETFSRTFNCNIAKMSYKVCSALLKEVI